MSSIPRLVIAVDGHSSCGKSTFARAIAKMLGYIHIDSGAMYRAVTWRALEEGLISGKDIRREKLQQLFPGINITFVPDAAGDTFRIHLNGVDIEDFIREPRVSDHVSDISALREVREFLVQQQRKLAGRNGVVMDGRDIGTVVFPNADLKIFMTASPEIRAMRRFRELQEKGIPADYEEVLRNIEQRDRQDSSRAISPLKKADDAILLDNSHMTVSEQMEWFRNLLKERWNISTDNPEEVHEH